MNQCCDGCQNQCQLPDDFVITSDMFTSSTQYKNPFLVGRYRLVMRGYNILIYGSDWDYVDNVNKRGGFTIIIPGFTKSADTVIQGQFY